MFRNSRVAKRADPEVRFYGKIHLLEPDPLNPDVHCVAKRSKCGVKLHDDCSAAFHGLTL